MLKLDNNDKTIILKYLYHFYLVELKFREIVCQECIRGQDLI